MAEIRKSTAERPLSQQEVLDFMTHHADEVFEVQKIVIPVKLIKLGFRKKISTTVRARDGRKIHETSQIADADYGVDMRVCIDGSIDQYAKKPHKVKTGYKIDDGRTFDDVAADNEIAAHTNTHDDIRLAMVASDDMYLSSSWGTVQFVAKGGIITILGDEAIGNNNPCDMVIHTPSGNGKKVLTNTASEIRNDMEELNLPIVAGADKFLTVAHEEDVKNPYINAWRETIACMKMGMRALQATLARLHKNNPTTKTPKHFKRRTQKKTTLDVIRGRE